MRTAAKVQFIFAKINNEKKIWIFFLAECAPKLRFNRRCEVKRQHGNRDSSKFLFLSQKSLLYSFSLEMKLMRDVCVVLRFPFKNTPAGILFKWRSRRSMLMLAKKKLESFFLRKNKSEVNRTIHVEQQQNSMQRVQEDVRAAAEQRKIKTCFHPKKSSNNSRKPFKFIL